MSKNYTMQSIAEALDGRLVGDGTMPVSRVAHPSDIRSVTDLVLAVDNNLLPVLASSGAKLAILSAKSEPQSYLSAAIVVDRPRLAMARLTTLFSEPVAFTEGVHPTAIIEPGVKLGANVSVGAYCYICSNTVIGANSVIHPQSYIGPNVVIGRNALIHAGVKIGSDVVIGNDFIIHFNSTIGADGFSFVTPQPGSVEEAKDGSSSAVTASNTELVRIASLGSVVIGDNVEMGANSSIDRGTIAATRIGNGTKIDNQVQIGHNAVVGENCLICGRVGIAGSAVIGNRVVLGGASGVGDHVKMGDDSVAMAMSGVAGNVPERTIVGGMPAMKREKVVENIFNVGRIRQLITKINTLTERVNQLDKKD